MADSLTLSQVGAEYGVNLAQPTWRHHRVMAPAAAFAFLGPEPWAVGVMHWKVACSAWTNVGLEGAGEEGQVPRIDRCELEDTLAHEAMMALVRLSGGRMSWATS